MSLYNDNNNITTMYVIGPHGSVWALSITDATAANSFVSTHAQGDYVSNKTNNFYGSTQHGQDLGLALSAFGDTSDGYAAALAYVFSLNNMGVVVSKMDPVSKQFSQITASKDRKKYKKGSCS